jgi:hypothetical protein
VKFDPVYRPEITEGGGDAPASHPPEVSAVRLCAVVTGGDIR